MRMLVWIGALCLVILGSLLTLGAVALFNQAQRRKLGSNGSDPLEIAARLNSIINASLDGVITADEKGIILDFSPSATEIFGWTHDEIVGQEMVQTIVPKNFREAHDEGMRRYVSTRERHVIDAGRLELSAVRKSGEEFPIELNITSTKTGSGEIFIAYIRDISRRINDERAILDEKDAAKAEVRAKTQFLAAMSHEMRTPLNSLLGVLELMKSSGNNKKQERHIDIAIASGEIILERVNDALDTARIESDLLTPSKDTFNLKYLVERLVGVLTPLAHEKGLRLDLDFVEPLDEMFIGDAGRINQILTNLIGNAIKFTEVGGVRIEVIPERNSNDNLIVFRVSDTGPGIETEHLESIFDEYTVFGRGLGRQDRGDGLGLSISSRVARLMGGELWVESEKGVGSLFVLSLPLERQQEGASSSVIQLTEDAKIESAPKNVLLVEDDAINRSVLEEMVLGFGHNVLSAKNGLEAVLAASNQRFDVIVMDINMPFLDGIEATRRIRTTSSFNRSTLVLGLSAHADEAVQRAAIQAGMNGFCVKPVRVSTLRNAIDGQLDNLRSPDLGVSPIDYGVFNDLREAIGNTRLKQNTDAYFEDVGRFLASLHSFEVADGGSGQLEELHKLRGGAATLGLVAVLRAIDEAKLAVLEQDDLKISKSFKTIRDCIEPTRDQVSLALEK